MTKHYEDVEIPATKGRRLVKTTCDLCGAELKQRKGSEVDRVEIVRDKGIHFPDLNEGERTEFDVCGTCFDAKLVPWMKSQGAEPRVGRYDY